MVKTTGTPPRPLAILYRGPLRSCNYACGYCPFAKRRETREALERDRKALRRFVSWCVRCRRYSLSIFFTPWGEALTRSWYREAMVELSRLPNVARVAAQTNLSASLKWVEESARDRIALWATYHPSQVSRERFLAQCRKLLRHGVRFSAGAVGVKENASEIEALRKQLPAQVYVWVNAYKDEEGYYTERQIRRFERVDPLFHLNTVRHPSLGEPCRAGASVISVDGEGLMRRCHFVNEPLGNIYAAGWERALRSRRCPNATCGCHIGYVHMLRLGLDRVFGEGILERIPQAPRQVSTSGR